MVKKSTKNKKFKTVEDWGMPRYCPNCGVCFKGKKIPEEGKLYTETSTHYSKLISLYSQELDRTVADKCFKCGFTFIVSKRV